MARFIYECDCGFRIDGRRTDEIAQHEQTCPIASAASAIDEIKDMVAFFTSSSSATVRVEQIAKMVLQLDSDLKEFYEEGHGEGALSTILGIKLFDFILSVNERLANIESKLEIDVKPILEPEVKEVKLELKKDEDLELTERLFKASQDISSKDDEEDFEEDE